MQQVEHLASFSFDGRKVSIVKPIYHKAACLRHFTYSPTVLLFPPRCHSSLGPFRWPASPQLAENTFQPDPATVNLMPPAIGSRLWSDVTLGVQYVCVNAHECVSAYRAAEDALTQTHITDTAWASFVSQSVHQDPSNRYVLLPSLQLTEYDETESRNSPLITATVTRWDVALLGVSSRRKLPGLSAGRECSIVLSLSFSGSSPPPRSR